jgi:hypothetical protein
LWNKRRDASLEREVRRNRPEARPEFVAMVGKKLTGGRVAATRPRVAMALVVTALLAIALVALGGISYAKGGAGSAVSGLANTLTLSSSATSASSPASDQYGIGECQLNYPDNSHLPRSAVVFNESEVLRGFSIVGTGANPGVAAWYSDEHALLLGIEPPNVTDMYPTPEPPAIYDAATKTARAHNPEVGSLTATDSKGRPLFPSAWVTKITPPNQTGRQGDWQQQNDNSKAQPPQDLFGTWKHATQTTDIGSQNDPPANNTFGPGADTPPSGLKYEKFRTEVRWDLFSLKDQNGQAITAHNAYRVEFMVHDGDQNKDGGDVGQACVNITIP